MPYVPYFEKIIGVLSHLLSGCVCPTIVEPEETTVARQQPGEHIPMTVNTYATIEELLGIVFSMWYMSYQVFDT
jgi:hypothetical protein